MSDITIVVPCPQCGQRLRGSAERLNQTARCPRGHEFLWNANSLRNPIQPPSKHASTWEALPGLGTLLSILGIAVLLFGGKRTAEIGFSLLAVGIGFLGIEAIRLRLGRALAERRYERWFHSAEGQRYVEYEEELKAAKQAFQRGEEAARRAADEKQRHELAQKARDRKYLLDLAPRDFEQYIADLFAALGYKVTLTPASSDEGVDAYLEKSGQRAIVQCKHFTRGAVSRPELQQFFGVLKDRAAYEGFFVTTGRFTEQAIEFARNKRIHLIDLHKLVEMACGAFTEEFIRSGPSGQVTRRSPRRRYWRRRWH